jgi:peptide/nickel transport system substrate-binding protein
MARSGAWDIALYAWLPDWVGNNGRSVISPLFDGRSYGPGSMNYGDYNDPATNGLIDQALTARTEEAARAFWQEAAGRVMEDAAIIPLTEQRLAKYQASRVRNCAIGLGMTCDPTALWLKGASSGGKP